MRWHTGIALFVIFICVSVSAQTSATNGTVRPISLEESIQLALQHNLGLQIQQLSPQMARYDLAGAYSYYEPAFSLRGEQTFRSSPGGFNTTVNLPTPPVETWQEHFNASVGGYIPTGMRYDLAADLTRTSGSTPGTNGLGGFTMVDRGFQYRPDVGVAVSQPLLRNFWTDANRTSIKVNKQLVKIAEYLFQTQVMDIVNRVQQAYYDLVFAAENIKVQEKALELAQRLMDENKKRVEIGTLAPLDEKQSESQRATALADLITARNTYGGAQNVLKNLITDRYTDWHMLRLEPTEKLLAMPESFNLVESWNKALNTRPDYKQLKEELERQKIILKFDYNQMFPSLDLIASVGGSGLAPTLGDSVDQVGGWEFPRWSGGAVLTVPFTFRKERSVYKRDKAAQKQALLQLKQLEELILVQVDDAMANAQSSFQRIQATRQAREFADEALKAEQTKLENGKSTTFVVLQLQSNLTKARGAEIQALADYQKALANFYFREGTTLERNKVIVSDK